MASKIKSFRVKIGNEMWTVRMKKAPGAASPEYDVNLRHLYLDPSKLKKRGIEHLVSIILSVRFRHFMTPSASRDVARVINRAHDKLLPKRNSPASVKG